MESANKGSGNHQAASSGKPDAAGNSYFTAAASSSGTADMKAPGADYRIPRAEFEKNPSAYFNDLHKKK
ncbi:hypothetical protein LINGRAHAP2_LOCUS37063 [Linum grandiflorum]